MSSVAQELRQRIETRSARVGVVGLGYVGLPLAVELARAGFETIGLDLDPRKIASISAGESYIPDVATSDIHALVGSGQLRATTDYRVVADLDTVNICVPTPLRKTKDPDMFLVISAGLAARRTRRLVSKPGRHRRDILAAVLSDGDRFQMQAHTVAMTAGFLGWFVCSLFASVAYNWTFYYLLALIVASREMVMARLRAARALAGDGRKTFSVPAQGVSSRGAAGVL